MLLKAGTPDLVALSLETHAGKIGVMTLSLREPRTEYFEEPLGVVGHTGRYRICCY
ncbi:MAG: hypothetical protein GWN93_26935 [Deltaproteobacteria bacterium]|nr:hypothetical protein [Deltaproteobacteria bacterium]